MTELGFQKKSTSFPGQNSPRLKYSKRFLHYSNLDPQYFVKTRPKIIHNLSISQLALENISLQNQRKLIQAIKNIKCSHILKLRLGNCSPDKIKKVVARLRAFKGLHTLRINFFSFSQDGLSQLRALPMRLASNGRRLKNLSLDFTSSVLEFDPTLHLTCLFLKRQIALKSLRIIFQRSICGDLSSLSKRLRKDGLSLTDLSLDLSRCSKMKKGSIRDLTSRGLSNLPHLKNLCLKLGTPFDKSNSYFAFNLENSKELISFDFDFPGFLNAGEQDFKSLTGQLRSWATSLKTLHVKFPNVDSEIFAESLADFKALMSLKLEFKEGSPITQEFMESFVKGLKALEMLEIFHLEMNDCELNSSIFEVLTREIKEKKSLKDLKLSFGKNPGRDIKGMNNLLSALKELKELEALNLSLEGCGIDNSSIDPLASSIEKLTKLKKLKLCLHLKETEWTQWYQRPLIELNMDRLSGSLSQLPNLSILKLNLLNINFDRANLIENIKKMESLRRLELFLNGNEDGCFVSMKKLSGLKTIPNLRDLSLNFLNPSQENLCDLFHYLECMNKLMALRIGFYQRQENFNENGERFSDMMKSLCGGLKSFEILFHHCDFIESDFTADLFKGLYQLKQAENVRFQLIQTGITYLDWQTKNKLLGNMVNMKNLQRFSYGVNDII